MLYAKYKTLSYIQRMHYMRTIFERNLAIGKRFDLEILSYSNMEKEILIRVKLAGFSKKQYIEINAWRVDLSTFDEIWICGPKANCSIPNELIEEILIDGKGVFTRA